MSAYFTSHHFVPHFTEHHHRRRRGRGGQDPQDEAHHEATATGAEAGEAVHAAAQMGSLDALARFLHAFSWHYGQQEPDGHGATTHPRFDLVETATEYTLHGELPGMNREGIVVEVDDDGNSVAISGLLPRTKPQVPAAAPPPAPENNIGVIHTVGKEAKETKEEKPEAPASGAQDAAEAGPSNPPAAAPATAEKHEEPHHHQMHWHVLERKVGNFHRVFLFPDGLADMAGTHASMSNGIITVVVPKKKGGAPKRRVPVSHGRPDPYGGMIVSP